MKDKRIARRNFIKTCVTATAAAGALPAGKLLLGAGKGAAGFPSASLDAKGLPTRVLGKSGIAVPIIGVGTGSRFCKLEDPEKSVELLNAALDSGLYYWDTAPNYTTDKVNSEERLGLVLKKRRKEVFLGTKVEELTDDGAMRQFEQSLKRLQTDHVDISSPQRRLARGCGGDRRQGRCLEALHKLREQEGGPAHRVQLPLLGRGHGDGGAPDIDTMLIALNH